MVAYYQYTYCFLQYLFKLNIPLRFCISSYRSKFLSLGTTGIVGCNSLLWGQCQALQNV